MRALLQTFLVNLRLHFRNKMAMIYSYLFPTIFLIAFWTLYRYDQIPLIRHVGEFLTISVLGGACFGLPTTMVSERERGVWRRYRLAPVSTGTLVVSTALARYVLLVIAGVVQLMLAMALGMPLPHHPLQLWMAFTFVAFAFIGVGLVIAMLADNVPAVQALGQCIFLPMLIIGGVAVPLESLPAWAEHLSAFLPGRYAVDAIQACANGPGLTAADFSVAALVAIGAAGCLAGAKLFRWDREQRFAAQPGKAWVAVALAAWFGVGIAAVSRRSAASVPPTGALIARQETPPVSSVPPPPPPPPASSAATSTPPVQPATPPPVSATVTAPTVKPAAPDNAVPKPLPAPSTRGSSEQGGRTAAAAPTPDAPAASSSIAPPGAPPTWQAVTISDIDRDLTFDRLPRDSSIVTPIAAAGQEPDPDLADQVAALGALLPTWEPGRVADLVQRARNLLAVAGVIDVAQSPMEPYVPAYIFDELRRQIPDGDLIKVLYWIAIHPDGGTLPEVTDLLKLGIKNIPADAEEIQNRTAIYAVKLLGRLTGHIK
jgi:ABC-2 type transporter